ncbi:MAG: hypothetical protein Q7S92_00840 [Candidatus Diapherotrites archaeon]|nr:hypothetical protein [Candidatus Diapherotrites archaeon]
MGFEKKILENKLVQDFFQRKIGEHSIQLIKLYSKGKNLTEDKLSKKIGIKVTEIRTILNKMHYLGMADYDKTRNKKTGWYNYDWRINYKRIIELMLQEQSEQLKKLEIEENTITEYSVFACKKKCDQIVFEIAVQYQFKCPSCSQNMDYINTETKSKGIKKDIKELHTTKEELLELQKVIK